MKIYRKLSFLASFVLAGPGLLAPAIVRADEPLASLPTEDAYFSDIPVVLSATRLAQPKSDAPAAVTVIDRSMIEASGIREVPELMRLVPGFQVGHDSETQFGSERTPVTYLGYSDQFSRKMQVLVDGRSVYDPMFGGVRWSELGLLVDDIERIEVIRGPNAASYGSNAFLGVINIITRDPASESGTTLASEASSAGKRLASVRHFGGSNSYKYRVTGFYLSDGPHVGRRDASSTQSISYRGNIKLENRNSIDLDLGVSQGQNQLGTSTDVVNPEHDGSVNNNYEQIKWTKQSSDQSEYSLQLYHNYSQTNNQYQTTISTQLTGINADMKSDRWDLEFQNTIKPETTWRWVWGAGVRVDRAYGKDWFNSTAWQENDMYRLFGNGEWRPNERWTFNLGAMAEQTTVAGNTLSPRLAANYHLNDSNTLRVAISQGYRNPSLYEKNANTVIHVGNLATYLGDSQVFYSNGSVHAAKVNNYELGFLHEANNDRFSFDSRLFLMQFRDTIAYYNLGSTTYPAEFGNGGNADIYGVEMQGKYKFSNRTSILASYAYAEHQGWYLTSTKTTPATTSSSDDRTPQHTFSMLLNHKIDDHWSTSLFYHYVSNVNWFNGTSNPDGYHILNARIARSMNFGSRKGVIELIGQNMTGTYYDFTDTLKMYRSVYMGIRIPL